MEAIPPSPFSGISGRGGVAAEVDGRAWARALLEVEAALAAALAECGLAERSAATEIGALDAEDLDLGRLAAGGARDGTPVPALLATLRESLSAEASRTLHLGATSQDIVDTATMLVARRALAILIADLDAAAESCALLARAQRDQPAAGRTLLQQAAPISVGLRAAGWLDGLGEAAAELERVRDEVLAVQLGGAVGTGAALGDRGPEVAAALAAILDLREPVLPWQAMRLRPARLAAALGTAAGVAGKVGRDVTLLAQTEVGELREGAGGGSSTLPHKSNPVAAVTAIACSERTPGLVATILSAMRGELERAAGSWQAEAETLSELLRLTGSAAAAICDCLAGLELDPERTRANLELTDGLLMSEALAVALTEELGRGEAQALARRAAAVAVERGCGLREAAASLPEVTAALDPQQLERALAPESYLGASATLVERALAAHESRRAGR